MKFKFVLRDDDCRVSTSIPSGNATCTWTTNVSDDAGASAPIPPSATATVVIVVRGGKGWTTSRDLDNAIKPLIDAVKKSGTIPDDTTAYVTKIEATYVPGDGRPAGVRVRVEHKGEPPCRSQR